MGLECMGDLNLYHISEVLLLAAKSLEALSDRYILDLSHMGVIRGFLEELNLQPRHEERFLSLLREKNCHGIQTLFDSLKIDDELREKAIALASAYGNMDSVLKTLESISLNETMDRAIDELSTVCGVLEEQGFDNVHLDFSIEGDMGYYNGFLFRGYIEGIPTGVLSGGQYDELMEKMGKASGPIGFAINLSLLEDYETNVGSYDTDVLLLYDSSASPAALMEAVQELVEQGNTVQAQQRIPEKLKYRRLLEFDGERVKEVIHDIEE